jgi:hypothetical protein
MVSDPWAFEYCVVLENRIEVDPTAAIKIATNMRNDGILYFFIMRVRMRVRLPFGLYQNFKALIVRQI